MSTTKVRAAKQGAMQRTLTWNNKLLVIGAIGVHIVVIVVCTHPEHVLEVAIVVVVVVVVVICMRKEAGGEEKVHATRARSF